MQIGRLINIYIFMQIKSAWIDKWRADCKEIIVKQLNKQRKYRCTLDSAVYWFIPRTAASKLMKYEIHRYTA